jgi:hypothetical protein
VRAGAKKYRIRNTPEADNQKLAEKRKKGYKKHKKGKDTTKQVGATYHTPAPASRTIFSSNPTAK